ncbi:acyl-CoA dehydrogenase family protein [Streptomyces sp. NPDC003656]|uniref:acyl-CoA dehydrogenase family protein n=1 Tax=Streptomyces sp. DSM 110735 TaxID=2775031 RepID=UPI0018F6FBB2|nr:acyl-CoA dehydrogenase family protein [Streptomyces sp. DSM 110735]MBJ7904121.1 acyl-CoA dehydrogenase family protein [Streptomyces sp. DSM 110735]
MPHPTAPTRDELVDTAAKLVPLLRSRALWIDEHRRLPQDVVTAVEESGLLRMQIPAQYGGYESDARAFVDVLGEIAKGNSSAAFCLSVYAALGWMAALWPDEALDEVFADPHVRISGTTAPTGTARRTRGGYLLSGKWSFNSGVLHSQWKINVAMPEDPADGTVPLFCLVPVADLRIEDDWHTIGLQGSGSVTTIAEEVFVPAHRVISGIDFYQNVSKSRINGPKPHYRVPVLVTTNAIQSGQLVGAAKYALASFLERLPGRPLTYTDYPSQREAPLTHLQVGEAALLIEDAEQRAHRFADLIARKVAHDEPWTTGERVAARARIGWIARQCKAAVDILAGASGGSSIHRDVPITRIQRDLHAATLHAMITPGVNVELYGRSLCGLEPNTAYL